MSERYLRMMLMAEIWFSERFEGLPPLELTEEQRRNGCDAVQDDRYRPPIDEIHGVFIADHKYELSYNQVCNAFFRALDNRVADAVTVGAQP